MEKGMIGIKIKNNPIIKDTTRNDDVICIGLKKSLGNMVAMIAYTRSTPGKIVLNDQIYPKYRIGRD